MSLYPGKPRKDGNKYVLDDKALADSMAKFMEEEMNDVYYKVKNENLPPLGKEDRRLLFTAIARGILKYLHEHEGTIQAIASVSGVSAHTHKVQLNVTLDKHVKHS